MKKARKTHRIGEIEKETEETDDHRETEVLRIRETENKGDRDSHETEASQEVPPLAASVPTLPKAAQLALAQGIHENCLFVFARFLKAFEVTIGFSLDPNELQNAFSLWWQIAGPQLPADADFDEYWLDFQQSYAKVRTPWGANSLEEAIRRTDLDAKVPHSERYSSPRIKRLVAVCYHLQIILSDNAPFFLSVRDAARIVGFVNLPRQQNLWVKGGSGSRPRL